MRSFLLIAVALLAFGATMTFESTDANAVVCARGVYRAGCAGYRGRGRRARTGPPLPLGAGQRRLRAPLLLTQAQPPRTF